MLIKDFHDVRINSLFFFFLKDFLEQENSRDLSQDIVPRYFWFVSLQNAWQITPVTLNLPNLII